MAMCFSKEGRVETPQSVREVEVLVETANKAVDLCNGVAGLPADIARNRDELLSEIYAAVDRFDGLR